MNFKAVSGNLRPQVRPQLRAACMTCAGVKCEALSTAKTHFFQLTCDGIQWAMEYDKTLFSSLIRKQNWSYRKIHFPSGIRVLLGVVEETLVGRENREIYLKTFSKCPSNCKTVDFNSIRSNWAKILEIVSEVHGGDSVSSWDNYIILIKEIKSGAPLKFDLFHGLIVKGEEIAILFRLSVSDSISSIVTWRQTKKILQKIDQFQLKVLTSTRLSYQLCWREKIMISHFDLFSFAWMWLDVTYDSWISTVFFVEHFFGRAQCKDW